MTSGARRLSSSLAGRTATDQVPTQISGPPSSGTNPKIGRDPRGSQFDRLEPLIESSICLCDRQPRNNLDEAWVHLFQLLFVIRDGEADDPVPDGRKEGDAFGSGPNLCAHCAAHAFAEADSSALLHGPEDTAIGLSRPVVSRSCSRGTSRAGIT